MRKLAWVMAFITGAALLVLSFRVEPPLGLILGTLLLIVFNQTLRMMLKQK